MKFLTNLSKFPILLLLVASLVSATDFTEGTDFPSTSTNPPVALTPGDTVSGRISNTNDRDMIRINVPANTSFSLSIRSNTNGFNVFGNIYPNSNATGAIDWIYSVTTLYKSFDLNGGTNGRTYYLQVARYNNSSYPSVNAGNYTVTYSNVASINVRDFTKVSIGGVQDLNLFGSALMIGNQLVCQNASDGATCQAPAIGATNNSINQRKVRIDPTGPTNNSMARLDLLPGDKVIWAGLYWSARIYSSSIVQPNADVISMKTPTSGTYKQYTSMPAKYNWYSDGSVFDYACMQDVTTDVAAGGAGEYYVGGIQASNGINTFAAWTLFVIVENGTRTFKNISVYDGFQAVYDDGPGGYPGSVSAQASGFLTPKTGAVNSTLFVFTGESESGINDGATLTNKSGTSFALSDASSNNNDLFNGSVSIHGQHRAVAFPGTAIANPNFQNLAGTDIDTLDVDKLSNFQTSTTITIASTGGNNADRYTLNMFALETELYVPKFCYDYAYKQNHNYFTEENDGTKDPYLVGDVATNSPVNMGIYIKNLVDSDITITDMNVNILDINTTQVRYKSGSIQLTPIDGIVPQPVSDSGLTIDSTSVKNIPIGDINSNQHFYLYYDLNPQKTSLNTPINIEARYTLTLGTDSIPFATRIGEKIEMCSDANFRYEPEYGIFSVVHNSYFNADLGGTRRFYNLPTQVTDREGNFKVVAFNETNLNQIQAQSTIVAVDMIDVSGFHDSQFSCTELNSTVSGRVWMIFDNNQSVSFNRTALQNAIANGMTTTVPTSNSLYTNATKNATFRVSFNVTDDNLSSLVQTERQSDGTYRILNYPNMIKTRTTCDVPVFSPQTGTTTNVLSDVCENQLSTLGMAPSQLKACMECLYSSYTEFVCARDNFSVRPEAFDILLIDNNNTNQPAAANAINLNRTADLAAGYTYLLEVNATNHINTNASPRYDSAFSTAATPLAGNFLGYAWAPAVGQVITGCNDITNKPMARRFSDGSLDTNTSLGEVGRYILRAVDRTWTLVDQLPAHQVGNSNFTGAWDCIGNSTPANNSLVQSNNPYPNATPPNYLGFLNGCNISSTHTNIDTNQNYQDYNTTFHPYDFNLTTIVASSGLNNQALAVGSYVYMADINNTPDFNMSVHFDGNIIATGKDDSRLSNFVNNCYAQPLDINLTYAPVNLPVAYQYRLQIIDNNITRDTNAIDLNNTGNAIQVQVGDFVQLARGSVNTALHLNYARRNDTAVNPQAVRFNNYNVACSVPGNCTFNADLLANQQSRGTLAINNTVTHYYARSHTIRQNYNVATGRADIDYETYCDTNGNQALLQVPVVQSKSGDPKWFINPNHNVNFGSANAINQKGAAAVTATPATGVVQDFTNIVYDGTRGLPYTATMQHNANGYLIYNRFNNNALTNDFDVEFAGGIGAWVGQSETTSTTNTNPAAATTSGRVQW